MLEIVKGYLKSREVEYKENVSLATVCSARIGGSANLIVQPKNASELTNLLDLLVNNKIKYKIVGRMSNILPSDEPYDGVIVRSVGLKGASFDGGCIVASVGESLPFLARVAAENSLGGLAELSGIPATVGGAVVGNAGAFGREISELVDQVTAYDPESGELVRFFASELSFGYRSSIFQNRSFVLLSVKLKLYSTDKNTTYARMKEVGAIRSKTQPSLPSLGSVFKRNGDLIPARLIDECGLKGSSVGGAMISDKHAGFIVNKGGATSADYKSLVKIASEKVFSRFGVRLQREVEYLQN